MQASWSEDKRNVHFFESKTNRNIKAQVRSVCKSFLFFLGRSNKKQKIYASIRCKLYLIKCLRANILIDNNIFALKSFVLNIRLGHALIRSCRVKITVRAKQKNQFLKKKLLAKKDKVILPCSETMILLLLVSLPNNWDFLFHPTPQLNLTLFAYIIYHNTKKLLIRNIFDRLLHILRCQRLGHIVDICYNNCFLIDANFAFDAVATSLQTTPFFEHELFCASKPINPSVKTTLDNRVGIYGDKYVVIL